MKEHLVIKVFAEAQDQIPAQVPYWLDFINDKTNIVERFHPEIDRIFTANNYKFWDYTGI